MQLVQLAHVVAQINAKLPGSGIARACEQVLYHFMDGGLNANSDITVQQLKKLPNLSLIAPIKNTLMALSQQENLEESTLLQAFLQLQTTPSHASLFQSSLSAWQDLDATPKL